MSRQIIKNPSKIEVAKKQTITAFNNKQLLKLGALGLSAGIMGASLNSCGDSSVNTVVGDKGNDTTKVIGLLPDVTITNLNRGAFKYIDSIGLEKEIWFGQAWVRINKSSQFPDGLFVRASVADTNGAGQSFVELEQYNYKTDSVKTDRIMANTPLTLFDGTTLSLNDIEYKDGVDYSQINANRRIALKPYGYYHAFSRMYSDIVKIICETGTTGTLNTQFMDSFRGLNDHRVKTKNAIFYQGAEVILSGTPSVFLGISEHNNKIFDIQILGQDSTDANKYNQIIESAKVKQWYESFGTQLPYMRVPVSGGDSLLVAEATVSDVYTIEKKGQIYAVYAKIFAKTKAGKIEETKEAVVGTEYNLLVPSKVTYPTTPNDFELQKEMNYTVGIKK